MKKGFMIGGIVSIVGIMLIVIGLAFGGNEVFSMESQMEQKTYTFEPKFENISLVEENASVIVKPSNDDKIHLVVYENETKTYKISESKNLTIEFDNLQNYVRNFFTIDLTGVNPLQTELYIPVGYECGLFVENISGQTSISDLTLKSVSVNGRNGAINLERIDTIKDFSAITVNGNISLALIKSGVVKVESQNGKIAIDTLDCESINISSQNGSTKVKDVYSNTFINVDYENGSVDMDNILFEDSLKAYGSNGAFKAVLSGSEADYQFVLKSENGSSTVNGIKTENSGNGKKLVGVKAKNGSIEISTKN